jgi:hypothetical protein
VVRCRPQRSTFRLAVGPVVVALGWAGFFGGSSALASAIAVSSDPFTNSTSQHATEVEPDSFAFGTTVVAVSQVGRFFDGGSSAIGWARSGDGGATWVHGFLPGMTPFTSVPGPYDRVSDPSVAYDRKHGVWLVSSLALSETPSVVGAAVLVSRSTDDGVGWGNPVAVVNSTEDPDKNWTVCDNTPTSPFYGSCYTEWDNAKQGDLIQMSVSRDGGRSWSAAAPTANLAHGIGGQPLVRSGGGVIVPILNAYETKLLWFRSVDGGTSWGATHVVTTLSRHRVAGALRAPPMPSAEIDRSGKIYVTWADCRFRSSCVANDIVMATLTGATWSPVVRIPLDGLQSGRDHFLPSIAVDRSSSGLTAHVSISYYYYPVAACSAATCKLDVGASSSPDGGRTWTSPVLLAGPMSLSWLPTTSQGRMVGDYFSTSYVGGRPHPFLAVALDPAGSGQAFQQFLATTSLSAPTSLVAASQRVAADVLPSTHRSELRPVTAR